MNGIHDVGGMDNIGPLVIEDKEPVFHADWERQVFSMNIAMIVAGYFEIDEVRRVTELMPAQTTTKNGCTASKNFWLKRTRSPEQKLQRENPWVKMTRYCLQRPKPMLRAQ